MKLSVAIPCFNEKGNIPLLLERFAATIGGRNIEVILVDNGSTDGSGETIQELVPQYPFARTIRVAVNKGYGYGILQGLKAAAGDFIGWTHADMQTDPADVVKAFDLIEARGGAFIYVKGLRGDRPLFDRVFTLGMSAFESCYFGQRLFDINAQPNIFPRAFYESWKNPPWDFSLELYGLYQARLQNMEILRFDVDFPERVCGVSSWNRGLKSKFGLVLRTLKYSYGLKHPKERNEMKKEKAIIFGAAGTGEKIYKKIKDKVEVIFFSENDSKKWGGNYCGVKIISPREILSQEYDKIYIGSMTGLEAITKQLIELGVPETRIVKDLPFVQRESRRLFLECAARLIYSGGIEGAVAEAGVYRGDFAKEINRVFEDRTLYLFDTFSGFSDVDIGEEKNRSMTSADYLKDTSEEAVLAVMPHREKCIVRKGYFPDTAVGIEEKFAFVSLDMDLYKPTLEGLRFFYPRMADGGIIAIHDYFSDAYPNVRTAVADYGKERAEKLSLCPVGDDISVAVIKHE